MKYLFPPSLQELIVTPQAPPYSSAIMLPYAEAVFMEGRFGSLLIQETAGNEFNIRLHIFQVSQSTTLSLSVAQPSAVLIYMLQGHASVASHMLEALHYYLFYIPPGSHPVALGPGHHILLHIELSASLPGRLAGKHAEIQEVWDRVRTNHPFCLRQDGFRINARIGEVLNRLLYCCFEEAERALYQQARVLDLLLLYAEDITNASESFPGRYNFSEADIRAVLDAEYLQVKSAADALPIKDIARKINLHPRKMQAGFKFLFGRNVHKMSMEARMYKAKVLLIEGRQSLSEIAWETGYCNASSFIRAFKRYVGVTPAVYRK